MSISHHTIALIAGLISICSIAYYSKRGNPILHKMHKLPIGTYVDYSKALPSLTAKAGEGDRDAQFTLAMMYLSGQGVPESYDKAIAWLNKSASLGEVRAQYNLAVLYAKGKIMRQDYVQAYKWLRIANSLGEPESAAYLEAISGKMSSAQVSEAQQLADEWKAKAAAP